MHPRHTRTGKGAVVGVDIGRILNTYRAPSTLSIRCHQRISGWDPNSRQPMSHHGGCTAIPQCADDGVLQVLALERVRLVAASLKAAGTNGRGTHQRPRRAFELRCPDGAPAKLARSNATRQPPICNRVDRTHSAFFRIAYTRTQDLIRKDACSQNNFPKQKGKRGGDKSENVLHCESSQTRAMTTAPKSTRLETTSLLPPPH